MKTATYVILTLCLLCASMSIGATSTQEALHRVLTSSTVSLEEFVGLLEVSSLPAFPPPRADLSGLEKIQFDACKLVWNRLFQIAISEELAGDKRGRESIAAMARIRVVLLRTPTYSNLILAAYAEEAGTVAILKALAANRITVDEARSMRAGFSSCIITPKQIVDAAAALAGGSQSLDEFYRKTGSDAAKNLDWYAHALGSEIGDSTTYVHADLLSRSRPAAMISYIDLQSVKSEAADIIIKYVSKGGALPSKIDGVGVQSMVKELKRIMPEVRSRKPGSVLGTPWAADVVVDAVAEILSWRQDRYSAMVGPDKD